METKKRQAKTEELSLSRFQKSSCLLKQPKNSKKILKKKAINPEIKNPSQVTISLRKVAIRKMESGNGLEKLKQGNRASRKTKFCVGGKQGKKRQLSWNCHRLQHACFSAPLHSSDNSKELCNLSWNCPVLPASVSVFTIPMIISC